MTDYQIFNEDCISGMSKLEAGSVDAIICDKLLTCHNVNGTLPPVRWLQCTKNGNGFM